MNSQALQFLYSHHERAIKKQVDFDLHAVFLMQEFRPTDHIENIIRMIHECFTNQHPPQNALQQQLVDAATLVQNRINTFHTHSSSNTSNGQRPFCLRFPTLNDVIKHSMELEPKCEVLPTDVMVVLIDEGGICVGIGLPPKPQASNSQHLPRDVSLNVYLYPFLLDADHGKCFEASGPTLFRQFFFHKQSPQK
jgi:hypothetical protein